MTLCEAWIREAKDGKQLVMATDSLVTGGFRYMNGTKLLTFNNRQGCALCWEGDTSFTYSFTENARVDVEFSDRLCKPETPLGAVNRRIIKVFNHLWKANLDDPNSMYHDAQFSFLFGGYCTVYKEIQLWHIYLDEDRKQFRGHRRTPSAKKPYLIGSGMNVARELLKNEPSISPYGVLLRLIEDNEITDVGGMPQLVTINEQGLVEIIGITKDKQRFLFGRDLKSGGHKTKVRYVPYKNAEF
jgi:hypothetical protein